jgi:trimethylamine--corrinoid protein Co-methyltransferase
MNLRSGAPTFGMPEPLMSNLVIGQLARRLNLPLRCGGALTSSKVADFQAAAESADSMLSTVLGGANFVLHAAGWLEGGLATGYEKLVLDADRLGAYAVVLRGFETDDDAVGRDAYGDVEPGGHFLGSAHTLGHYTSAFYEAQLSDSNSVEQWEEHGARDSQRRAHERWNKLLAEYQPPPLDPDKREALEAFVAHRKEQLPEAWY